MVSRRGFLSSFAGGLIAGVSARQVLTQHPNKGIPSPKKTSSFKRTTTGDTITLNYLFPPLFDKRIVRSTITVPKRKYVTETKTENIYHTQIKESIQDSFVSQDILSFIPEYKTEEIRKITNFVQMIKYSRDHKSTNAMNYSRHPVETLVDNVGDCKDKTILLYSILKNRGYTVGYVIYPQHIAPIVARDEVEEGLSESIKSVVQTDTHEYITLESTHPKYIGKSDYKKKDIIYSYTEQTGFNIQNPEALGKQAQKMFL